MALPAKALCRHAGLSGLWPHFLLRDSVGIAVQCGTAPTGWSGHLTYIRADVLDDYLDARGGEWLWLLSGRATLGRQRRDGLRRWPNAVWSRA